MKTDSLTLSRVEHELFLVPDPSPVELSCVVSPSTRLQLLRMFRDPYLLEKEERVELVEQLRVAVSLEPGVPELRVFLGMALCVNFDGQAALTELREAVRLDPASFLARLKLGELLMRLRICTEAAEETRAAAKLASNAVQSELARRQTATIRTMLHEGVERGGAGIHIKVLGQIGRLFSRGERSQSAVVVNPR